MTGSAAQAAGAGVLVAPRVPCVSSHQGSQAPPSPGTTTVNTTLRRIRLSDWPSDRRCDRPGDRRGDRPGVRFIASPRLYVVLLLINARVARRLPGRKA